MRYFMLSAILFIIITSTAYASPVHVELRDIASPDAPAITKRLVRRIWLFSQSQDSLEKQYELPSGLPNEMNFRDLDRNWREDAVLAKDADSILSKAHLKEFETDDAELKKPNAVMKCIKISGARTSKEFKMRWYDIVKELSLLRQLHGDDNHTFKWGHSKDLDIVYIAIRVGRNRLIDVPKVSLPSQPQALPEVKKFIRDHRLEDDDFCYGATNWVLFKLVHSIASRGRGAFYI
ncbi:hypothetical protein F5887DRAFT_256555 [Amanita rubescens]|nr:hypothetical protein F5887DRAFT_256555 [Amanita rubescens]